MPLQSVRPDIHRGWRTELLDWDGDASTVDALILRLDQIAAGHGVSLDHYRQAEDPAADWTPRQPDAIGTPPDLTALRAKIKSDKERARIQERQRDAN